LHIYVYKASHKNKKSKKQFARKMVLKK